MSMDENEVVDTKRPVAAMPVQGAKKSALEEIGQVAIGFVESNPWVRITQCSHKLCVLFLLQ